jgi:hypothetical protein
MFNGTTSRTVFWHQFKTIGEQLVDVPGEIHIFDHHLAAPYH